MESTERSAKNAARSCLTCSKAKARCVRPPGATICDRCARLKKECHVREPVLRRRKASKTTRAAQLEKLEHKIEHLVNALSTNTQQSPSSYRWNEHQGQLSPPMSQVSSTAARASGNPEAVVAAVCQDPREQQPFKNSAGRPIRGRESPTPGPAGEQSTADIRARDAHILLHRYRRLMSAGLPFVVIPHGATTQSMQDERPMLLQSICVVAYYHDFAQQRRLLEEAIAAIGHRVLVKNEKTVDILQAILLLTAWYHPHIFSGAQMTNLLHIAMAVTTDLGIDRLSQLQDFKQLTTKAMHGPCLTNRAPSLEERRVLLGLFYKTSVLSSSFNKINALPFTPYMEDCLTALTQAREYDSDLFLVQMVRVQRVVQAAHSVETPNAPYKMFIKAFQADLKRLQDEDPIQEHGDVFLKLQYLTAEVFSWGLSLLDISEREHNSKGRSLSSHLPELYPLVDSVKRFFDVWWTIPASTYYLLPFSCFGQYASAFICLTKLESLEIDGWDLRAVSESLSFRGVVDESVKRYEEATRSTCDGTPVNNDAFGRWALRVSRMKQVFESKFGVVAECCHGDGAVSRPTEHVGDQGLEDRRQEKVYQQGGGLPQQPQYQQPSPPGDLLSADFFGYLDDGFWSSFVEGDLDILLPGNSTGNLVGGGEGGGERV